MLAQYAAELVKASDVLSGLAEPGVSESSQKHGSSALQPGAAIQSLLDNIQRRNEAETELALSRDHRLVAAVAGEVAGVTERNRFAAVVGQGRHDDVVVEDHGMRSAAHECRGRQKNDVVGCSDVDAQI